MTVLAAVYLVMRTPATTKVQFGLLPLFLFFCRIGSILFGSGYVLLAFLQSDLVQNWHWLTTAQLLDAVAVGQVTPGPVFTTATFIGYLLGGFPGALIATAGIFLPAFFFVAISGPLVPRLRKSALAGAFLDGVVVASLALMAVVTWSLGRDSIIDLPTAIIALGSAVLLIRFRLNSLWLVLGGALIGLLAYGIRTYTVFGFQFSDKKYCIIKKLSAELLHLKLNFDGFVKSDLSPLTPSLSPQKNGGERELEDDKFRLFTSSSNLVFKSNSSSWAVGPPTNYEKVSGAGVPARHFGGQCPPYTLNLEP
jgi:chromate transport protein ChrA